MGARIVFDGIKEGCHTWFTTRKAPDDHGRMVGGDYVEARPGQSFPLDYVDPVHAHSHVSRGHARIVEDAPVPVSTESDSEPKPQFFRKKAKE